MASRPRFGTREEYEAWRDGRREAAPPVEALGEPAESPAGTGFEAPWHSKLLALATGWFFLSPVVIAPLSIFGVLYYAGSVPERLLLMAIPALLVGIPGWFGTVGLWRGTRDGVFHASVAWAYKTASWSVGLLLGWGSLDSLLRPVGEMVVSMAVLWGLLAQLRDLPPGTGSSASDPMGLRFVAGAGLFGVGVGYVFTRF